MAASNHFDLPVDMRPVQAVAFKVCPFPPSLRKPRSLLGIPLDVTEIATLQNTFNRTAAVLGWQRRARDTTPTISEYAARRAAEKAAQRLGLLEFNQHAVCPQRSL